MKRKGDRMGVFADPYYTGLDPVTPFLGALPKGEIERIDNPDGVVGYDGIETGPYEWNTSLGRNFSQGPGTDKLNTGNASGKPRQMRVTTGKR